jgi:hypothetical protein
MLAEFSGSWFFGQHFGISSNGIHQWVPSMGSMTIMTMFNK